MSECRGEREGVTWKGEEKDKRFSKQNKSEPKITSKGCGSWFSNPRQEKRRQKGLEAAYNSGLMAGRTKGVDGENDGWRERRCTVGEEGLEGRITRSLPVAPARASVSGRVALSLQLLPSRCLPPPSATCLLFPPPPSISPVLFCSLLSDLP